MSDLLKLAERVEAGESFHTYAAYPNNELDILGKGLAHLACKAINMNSLDAAKALYDSVYPSEVGSFVQFLRHLFMKNPTIFDDELPRYIVAQIIRAKASEEGQ